MIILTQSYTLLPSTSDGIFLDVANLASSSTSKLFGTLFKSNQDGHYFSQSLAATLRSPQGQVDFEKVNGIDGIMLSNSIANPTDPTSEWRTQSVISHDDGSTWKILNAPEVDSLGKGYNCTSSGSNKCQLHLHSYSSIGHSRSVFSPEGSTGLVLGVGNVGSSLGNYADSDVFLSRDAGKSWSEIRKGPHKWAVGDYGNVIVLIRDDKPTMSLDYSWDFGSSWSELKFSDKPLRLQALSTRMESSKFQFLVMGYAPSSSTFDPTGMATIYLDFSRLFEKKCSLDDDFEKWSPGECQRDCFLGRKLSLLRRRKESLCFFGDRYEPSANIEGTTCECSARDFEW